MSNSISHQVCNKIRSNNMANNNTSRRWKHEEPDFSVVKHPVTFYKVSVARGKDGNRRMFTTPISMNGMCAGCTPVDPGEMIIACVPPTPGTVNVYVEHTTEDGEELSVHIGVEVPGIEHPNWNDVATEWVIAAEPSRFRSSRRWETSQKD